MGLFNTTNEDSFFGFKKNSTQNTFGSRGNQGSVFYDDSEDEFQRKMRLILQQNEGTPYYELLKNNPYLTSTVNETLGDQLLNTFGLRSPYDSSESERRAKALDYVSQVLGLKFENDYNSDSAKTQRMQEAGLNADLLGTSGAADSATSPELSPRSVPQSPIDDIGHYVNIIGSCISNAFSIFDRIIGIKRSINDLDSSEIDVESKSKSLGESVGENLYTEDLPDPSMITPSITASMKGLSKRNRKRTERYLRDYFSSVRSSDKYWTSKSSSFEHMKDYAYNKSYYAPDDTLDTVVSTLADLTRETLVSSLESNKSDYRYNIHKNSVFDSDEFFRKDFDFQMSNFSTGMSRNRYERDYYNNASGKQKAEYENSNYLESEQMKHTRTLINDSMRELISSLSAKSKKGDMFAKSLLISLAVGMSSGITPFKRK